MSGKNSIQVAIKVRPLSQKEKDQSFWRIVNNSIQLLESQGEPYYFDHIFDQDATNEIIFDTIAKKIVQSAIQGFNGTIFAYGQTSSGKTYTMMGDDDNPGVMVLAAKEIFKEIERSQDRQFLLRVGYIEIYNEKIYDLLNKKNPDLKIHETPTGIVSVNCEEVIIRSQDDLLFYLNKGGKERTVGETNMNERSSRSHAIFRIIIESRKMERGDDDTVIQSVINLVDLAGSERADQTGATGTRLKEGGHINKSLLFLSNVIKRLSENEDDKYISFRDSKLTRILQASLGGNALTTIICTIKANAVEETQSTLNFALRAKAIKNKPQVNEYISDATMMKRLEQEIKDLKLRLEEEQRKNESQIKVRQLEQRIKDEDLKIISCNSLNSQRNREKRRRTWCPSSTNLDTTGTNQQPSALPIPLGLPPPSRLQAPRTYNTPLITMRQPIETPPALKIVAGLPVPPDNMPEIDEEFAPAELVDFDVLTPLHTTPYSKNIQRVSITPKLISCPKSTLAKVEHDLLELQNFTNLENKIEVKHEIDLALKQKLETLSQRNAVLENERLEYLHLKKETEITTENLSATQKRYDELQVQLSKLAIANKTANEKIAKYESELAELKETNEKLAMESREAVNLEFEYKRHKNKAKLRENELLEVLNEKSNEITKLEKSLNAFNVERMRNTKEELLQRSLNEDGTADADGKVCVKCEDLHRLLEENKKNTLEFEKLTLEYEKLKLNYTEIEKENETNKLKIVHLEELQGKDKAECDKLLLDVQQLREKLHSVQSDYALLSSENSSKHEECMALHRQVEVAREEMVVLEEKFTKLDLSWQEQQQTINEIEIQYVTIQTKYEQLQTQYEQLESSKGQSLNGDYKRLEKENVDLQTEIEELKKKVHDAQQRLLESNAKYEETAKETETAQKEYSAKTSEVRQENEQLKNQLSEIQTQFEDLQKEYDDLSNQLMDNLQENEQLKTENTELKEKLKDNEEKNPDMAKAEVEINELRLQLEKVLSSERKDLLNNTSSPCQHNSSMRSSGVCIEEEENLVDCCPEFKKFSELFELITEIELEHEKGRSNIFKSLRKDFTPNSYKLYLKNILGVQKTQKEFEMEIENLHLQGSFNQHSFHIVKLRGEENKSGQIEFSDNDTNGCGNMNMAEYIQQLKEEITQLKVMNEEERLSNKSLLESTERACSEMREQITQLSAELLEKSMFVENCACKVYQQQIENLEKEKADVTIMCEELQEKLNFTLNASLSCSLNSTAQQAEFKAVADDKLNELEQLKLREQELLKSYDAQMKTLEEMTQRCIDMETDLESAQEHLNNQGKEFKEKLNELQLENLQKLELSANKYRDNIKKYNTEWEGRKLEYEQTIKELQNQIDVLKQEAMRATNDLQIGFKKEGNICDSQEDIEKAHNAENEDDREAIKQDKCRLEEEKLSLQQKLNLTEVTPEHLKKINPTQNEKTLDLLDVLALEELMTGANISHTSISKENVALKTEIFDVKPDLNCTPESHDKLNQEQSQMQDELRKAETRIQEFCKSNAGCDEVIQTKLSRLAELEKENEILVNDFENPRLKHAQVRDNLNKAEEQLQKFSSEVLAREDLTETLQTKLAPLATVEEEKRSFEKDLEILKLEYAKVQDKLLKAEEEIQEFTRKDEACNELIQTKLTQFTILEKEKNNLLNDFENIKLEYEQVQDKLRKAEEQIQEFSLKDEVCNELIQSKLAQLTALEEEKNILNNALDNHKLECAQVQDKLHKAEEQIREFSRQDLDREELIHDLQTKLAHLTALEEEKKSVLNEFENLKLEHIQLKDKLHKTEEQMQEFTRKDEACNELIQTKFAQLTALEEEKNILNNALENHKLACAQVQDKLHKAEEQIREFSRKDEACNELIQTKLAQLTKLEEEKKTLNTALENHKLECSQVQDELNKAEEQLCEFFRKDLDREELIQDLQTKLAHLTTLEEEKKSVLYEFENLKLEHVQVKDKLHKAEEQMQELARKDGVREELIRNLQTKLAHLTTLEEEKNSVLNEFENLKLEHAQVRDKLQKTEVQIQELCSEDATREELIQSLQTKLCNLDAVDAEKKKIELENLSLKETLKNLQEKENDTFKEIDDLRQQVNALNENITELVTSEEKLHEITNECNLLQTDNVLLNAQVSELMDECKSLAETCSILEQEKTTLSEQLKCHKENEKAEESLEKIMKEKSEVVQNLRLTKEQLETIQNQLKEKEQLILQAREEKTQIQQDLYSLKDSLIKTIEEKNNKLEETEKEKEKTKQDNEKLYQDMLELKQSFTKALEKKQEQQQKLEDCKQDNVQHKKELTLDNSKQKQNNMKQDLQTLKESLFTAIKEKQQDFNILQNNYKEAQEQNQELQKKLKDLTINLISCKQDQKEKSQENTQLQTELHTTKESLNKLQEDLQNQQEKFKHYQKLQEDKQKLETTLNVLKKAQTGAVSSLQEEKDELHKTLQQYQQQNEEFKQKEETFKLKVDSLSQQLHEMRSKVRSYEQLLLEHEQVESVLTTTTAVNEKLQQEMLQLTSQQENYVSQIEKMSSKIEQLNLQLDKHNNEKQTLQTHLSLVKETLRSEQLSLQKERNDLKSSAEELKMKYDSLLATNTQLETLNQQMQQQLDAAKQKLREFDRVQVEVKTLRIQHGELQQSLEKTVDEAGRCSLILREDIERHKQLLHKQTEKYNSRKIDMETKQQSLTEENLKLSANIEALRKEKHLLEEMLRDITVRNFEQDLQRQAIDATANTSNDSNCSYSPRARKSLDRKNDEDKLTQQKNSATAERKNRRLSTHDERRRQSYWGAAHDKETMTDPLDKNCNCMELDRKLKECERNLFIKNSHVTALSMELKNHPLKEENAFLKKRLQEELDKHHIEIKRYKSKLSEQTVKVEKAMAAAAHATAKSAHIAVNAELAVEQLEVPPVLPKVVADVEIQTDDHDDLTGSLRNLQGKYNDLKNICRHRYNVIKELEEKVAQKENSDGNSLATLETAPLKLLNNQCDSLKKELNSVKEKYEYAKKVLNLRREEIAKLRAQLQQIQ